MNNILYFVYWFYCLAAALAVTLTAAYYTDGLKRGGFHAGAYIAWVRARFSRDWFPLLLIGLMSMLLKICNVFFVAKYPLLAYICFYSADALFLYMLFSLYVDYRKTGGSALKKERGPVLRILAAVFLIALLCQANLMRETRYYGTINWLQYLLPYLIGYLPAMLLPLLVLLGFCVTSPRLAFGARAEGEAPPAEPDAPQALPTDGEGETGQDDQEEHAEQGEEE